MSPAGDRTADRSGSRAPDERFERSHRLRRREEFLRVQRHGKRVHTKHFVLVVWPRPDGGGNSRLGVTVTKKVAAAVGRNRVKRVVREVFRRNRSLFPEGCDVVVIAKSGSPTLGYEDVRSELARVRAPLASAAHRAGKRRARAGQERRR